MKLTTTYRREASELASSLLDNGGIVTSLQQCLGRNALSSQEPASMDIPCSFLYCHVCGGMLQPGKNGTTLRLRSVGRGKTRRRRASRRKAAEYRSKKQSSVTGGRKWREESVDDGKEERDLTRVTDGTCRNAIVVTCGSCGWKLKCKGLPPVRQQHVSAKEEPKKQAAAAHPSEGIGDGDIVSLPNPGKRLNRISKRKMRKGISTARKQKSGLLDFLSSLND